MCSLDNSPIAIALDPNGTGESYICQCAVCICDCAVTFSSDERHHISILAAEKRITTGQPSTTSTVGTQQSMFGSILKDALLTSRSVAGVPTLTEAAAVATSLTFFNKEVSYFILLCKCLPKIVLLNAIIILFCLSDVSA
jgi:hypothetical protein